MRPVLRTLAAAIPILFIWAATAAAEAPSPLIVVAEFFWEDGDFDEARDTLGEISREDQSNWIRAQELLIQIDYLEGRIEECKVAASAVLEIEPDNAVATAFLIRCWLRTGFYGSALEFAETKIKKSPKSVLFQSLLADALDAGGEADRAQAVRRSVVELLNAQAQFDVFTLVSASAAMRKLGEFESANQCLQLAQDLDINDPFMKLEKVRLYRATQGYAIAEKTAYELTKFNPSIALAYAEWAEVKWDMRSKEEDVAQLCTKALKLDPTLLNARARLIFYALIKDDRANSEALIAENLESNPRHAPSKNLKLAAAYLAGGEAGSPGDPGFASLMSKLMSAKNNYAESARWAEAALEAGPDLPQAMHDLGFAMFRMGDYAESRALLEKALAAFPYALQTRNLLTYLDGVVQHAVTEHGALHVAYPKGEEALARYAEVRGAQILAKESAAYNTNLTHPLRVQLCANLDDLAVITEGIPFGCCVDPAHPGTTGVVRFDDTIFLWTPKAAGGRRPNYRWDEALHRGIVQAVVRAATNDRAPLWLEEGVAGYAVWQANDEWSPPFLGLVIADLDRGLKLPVAGLAEGFLGSRRPYYQVYAPLLIEDWTERYGASAIQKLMKEIANGVVWPEALERAFGDTLDQIDQDSRESILTRYALLTESIKAVVEKAQALFDNNASEDAALVMAEVLERNPYDRNGSVLVLDLLETLGTAHDKSDAYYRLLEATLTSNRADADARFRLAEWHHANHRNDQALDHCQSAVGIRPGWLAAHRLVSEIALELERYDTAYASLAVLHEARPKHVKVLQNLVLCAKALDLDEDAAQWNEKLKTAALE